MTPTQPAPPSPPARSPRRWLLVVAATVVATFAVLTTVLITAQGGGTPDAATTGRPAFSPAAPESSAPSGSPAAQESSPAPPEAGPSEPAATAVVPAGADQPPPSRGPVALDESAEDGGISAEVVRVEAVKATGTGPGNVSGPALRVTVRLGNGTSDHLDLGGVTVDLAWSEELTPASPIDDPSAIPFSSTLAPGDSVEGRYVFGVPEEERDHVTVSVAYRPGAPVLVLTGPAT